MTDIFRHADKQLAALSRYMAREFQNLSVSLSFDELNVIDVKQQVGDMYVRIDREVRRRFQRIIKEVYKEAGLATGKDIPPLAIAAFLALLLKGYDNTTQYVYTHEWTRKRDRMVEAIMSSEGLQEMRRRLRTGLNVTLNQVRQYGDDITMETVLVAYKAAKIPYVRWVTQKDDRVCAICGGRDNKVYRIDRVPPLPAHWRCRCDIIPVEHRTIF